MIGDMSATMPIAISSATELHVAPTNYATWPEANVADRGRLKQAPAAERFEPASAWPEYTFMVEPADAKELIDEAFECP